MSTTLKAPSAPQTPGMISEIDLTKDKYAGEGKGALEWPLRQIARREDETKTRVAGPARGGYRGILGGLGT